MEKDALVRPIQCAIFIASPLRNRYLSRLATVSLVNGSHSPIIRSCIESRIVVNVGVPNRRLDRDRVFIHVHVRVQGGF